MAAIVAELDVDSAKPGESIQYRTSGPVVVTGYFPMFEAEAEPIFDSSKSIREQVHLLIDAFFDKDERLDQGHFYNITLNL